MNRTKDTFVTLQFLLKLPFREHTQNRTIDANSENLYFISRLKVKAIYTYSFTNFGSIEE